jgi:eukaryotic-like serine/threonine-protein kinase
MAAADPSRARVDAVFAEALDLTGPQQAAYLDTACAAEPGLRAAVEELLRLAARADGVLSPGALAGGPLWQALAVALETESPEAPTRIGPWRVERELGRGGMGTVYLAHRADGEFEQTAALKLLRAGVDSEEVLLRFEQERQILARLEHPNVARLLDGGRTPEGRPYFAMEYVQGRAIDVYCDAERLSVEERLELFAKVARAVQYAHRNLVVHRDLKPSNIVVTAEGGVKLLDFGIAKLLAREGTVGPPMTRTMARVLTPEYASPEQVLGQPVTTTSDVYQLGLLLYELLSGRRAQRIEDAAPRSLQQAVCEDQPTRPSTQAGPRPAAMEVAAARRTTPRALARKLRGDLDNVVLMALRKEPERRYASVEQLVEDLERYRRGLPVRARPDTLGYRTRKFLRRHPWGVAAAAAFGCLLVGYVATVTHQARELARERDLVGLEARKAERVRDFLLGLFEAADPYRTKGVQVTAGELVEAGARKVHGQLGEEPEVRAELLGVLGTVLWGRAAYERAETLLAEAVTLERATHTGDHPHVARALQSHSAVLIERGEVARAEQLAREALEMRRRLHPAAHPDVVDSLAGLAMSMAMQGRSAEAEAGFREALAIRRQISGPEDPEAATLLNNIGVQLGKQARHEESEATHREALAVRRRLHPAEHPAIAESLNNLAATLRRTGHLEEAEGLYREALAVRRTVFGSEHPNVANTLNNLGELARRLGRLGEAEASHREALAIRRKALGPTHSNVAMSLHHLAATLRDRGDTRQAEPLFREALGMSRATLPAGHAQVASAALSLGRLLVSAGRLEEADRLVSEALAVRLANDGERSAAVAEARLASGLCRAAQGRRTEARALLLVGLQHLRESGDADRGLVAEAEAALAGLPGHTSGG